MHEEVDQRVVRGRGTSLLRVLQATFGPTATLNREPALAGKGYWRNKKRVGKEQTKDDAGFIHLIGLKFGAVGIANGLGFCATEFCKSLKQTRGAGGRTKKCCEAASCALRTHDLQ